MPMLLLLERRVRRSGFCDYCPAGRGADERLTERHDPRTGLALPDLKRGPQQTQGVAFKAGAQRYPPGSQGQDQRAADPDEQDGLQRSPYGASHRSVTWRPALPDLGNLTTALHGERPVACWC